jgi:RNA polymerase primary sigma factor
MRYERPTDNIDLYMQEIEQYPLLTREQEKELAAIIHGSDPDAARQARDKLIVHNLRLSVVISHEYKKYASLSDLIQEANRGLVVAAEKFDPERSPKFSLAAHFWCKHFIRRYLASNSRTIHLPSGAAQLAAKVAKTRNAFEAAHGREPTDDELANLVGISKVRLNCARTADISLVSTNEKLDEDSDTTFEDMLSQEDDYSERQQEANDSAVEQLIDSLDGLTDMDRFLIRYTYGIGCTPVSLEALTTETGWCQARIRGRLHQIHQKLRQHIGEDALEV